MELRLTESFDLSTAQRHDPAAGVVYGVKVLGLKSRNGKQYSREALREAHKKGLFNRAVYINHPNKATDDNGGGRDLRERFGRLRESRLDAAGEAFADFHYNPAHSYAREFQWFADNDPHGIGFSINGIGHGKRLSNGDKLVESIRSMASVDLVDDPATVDGLFEQTEGATMGGVDPAGVEVAPGADDVTAKLGDLAKTFTEHPDWDAKVKLSKLKTLLKLLEDETGAGDAPAEPAGDEEMMEQLRQFSHPAVKRAVRNLDTITLREQAKAAGIPEKALTPKFVTQLVAVAGNPVEVTELIEDRKLLLREQGTTPKSADTTGGTAAGKNPNLPAPKEPTNSDLADKYFGADS